jgi:hypothetical protein
MNKLRRGPRAFPDTAAWQGRLRQLGITTPRHVKIATEGALLGSLIAHGVSPELVVLSDGAGQIPRLVDLIRQRAKEMAARKAVAAPQT